MNALTAQVAILFLFCIFVPLICRAIELENGLTVEEEDELYDTGDDHGLTVEDDDSLFADDDGLPVNDDDDDDDDDGLTVYESSADLQQKETENVIMTTKLPETTNKQTNPSTPETTSATDLTIELAIVADHTVFALALEKSGQDKAKAKQFLTTRIEAQIAKINKVYHTLKPPVTVKLAKLIIWEKAPIPIPADPIGTEQYWKAVIQNVSAFYLGVDVIAFGHAPGFSTSPGQAFNTLSCDGSLVFHEDLEIDKAYVMSHELGHIIGLCHVDEVKQIQQNHGVCMEFQNVPEAMACEKTEHTIMSTFATVTVDESLKFSSCAQAMWEIKHKKMDETFGAKNCWRTTNQPDFTALQPIAEQDCKAPNEMFVFNRCFVLSREADYNTTLKTCGTKTLRMDTLTFLPKKIQDKLGPQLPRTKMWRIGEADFERSFCPVYKMTDGPSFVTGWRSSCLVHRKGLCEKIHI